jgi:threonine dehydrogenase-like Zn-dependent dehydrogenase
MSEQVPLRRLQSGQRASIRVWDRETGAAGTVEVDLNGLDLFFAAVQLPGGPAPVRRFLPQLIQLIWDRTINPGKVFDLELPLEQAVEGYQAMHERRATKVLLTV